MLEEVSDSGLRTQIVALRYQGKITGQQLRIMRSADGRRFESHYFGVGTFGTPQAARAAALKFIEKAGLPAPSGRTGRTTRRTRTTAAGIRFYWVGANLEVVASWIDRRHSQPNRSIKRSVERHGIPGAIDDAIAWRTSCGAPAPGRQALIEALTAVWRQGPPRPR